MKKDKQGKIKECTTSELRKYWQENEVELRKNMIFCYQMLKDKLIKEGAIIIEDDD